MCNSFCLDLVAERRLILKLQNTECLHAVYFFCLFIIINCVSSLILQDNILLTHWMGTILVNDITYRNLL